ncbi:MAG TPA: GMC family oxidoreductase [Steroidobacteraceae bacterium]
MSAALAYDAIVVGSGAGGAAVAYRLVRSGLRVLQLEKGTYLPVDGSTLDVERVVHQREFLAREPWVDGRGATLVPEEHFNVGGKTKWYGAALLRFSPAEFRAEPAHGCRGWPISYEDLLPFYEEAESLLGVRDIAAEPGLARLLKRLTGPRSAWHSAPMPMALGSAIAQFPLEAAHFDGFASVRNLKGDADRSLLALLAGEPGYTLVTGAEVHSLCAAAGAPQRVTGVRLADGREFRAERVVLAAGALHSPRLLARHLEASGLARSLPMAGQVGRNLKLHLLTALVAIGARRQTDLIRKTRLLTHEDFPHSSAQPLGFDGELIATLVPPVLPRALRRAVGARAYGFFLQTEDGSEPRNRVLERGRAGAIERVFDYEERRLAAAGREHRRFTRALQRSLLGAGLLAIGKRIGLAGTAHACGTLICGADPRDSVVDAGGQVHGLSGLYVADGSVLPRISRVNPALSIYAWGLRVGALIAGQPRRSQQPAEALS